MAELRRPESSFAPVAADPGIEAIGALATELHTMSQPMTALLCSLEIGSMTGTLEGYAEAVRESLVQCDRLMQSMSAMRSVIARVVERA